MICYYDSCVFGNASNPDHEDYKGCVRATQMNKIDWEVSLSSEITLGELPSVKEMLEQFSIYCAMNGIVVIDVSLAESKIQARELRSHKRPLSNFGFSGQDWNHLMAAAHSRSSQILTTDEDFFDPANKSTRASSRKKKRVADYIRENLEIMVVRP